MKKITILMMIALMSLCLFGCDIPSSRPYTADVTIIVEDIPAGVKAMSIWCTANSWKADKVNGSDEYIAKVKTDADGMNYAEFTLKGYTLSVPLQFQFTPMPAEDTKMGDDWWSYAISGSSSYGNDKNNMKCNFSKGTTIVLNKETYGASYWTNKKYPIYGVSASRWFNENWTTCFSNEP
jgi:hypothetical protein